MNPVVLDSVKQRLAKRLPALRSFVARVVNPREAGPAPQSSVDLAGRVGFAVGTGRCGSHFLAELLKHEPGVAVSHERDRNLETFHRYCKWYELPVDHEGYLQAMEAHIRRDLARAPLSFESSCHLSLSMRELDERFQARFVLLVRHPRDVVKSLLGKGLFEGAVVQKRPELALGYQEGKFHHFLGRIMPRGDALPPWIAMSRVGKLAWYWRVVNQAILDQAAALPAERYRMYRLEDFDHAAYRDFASFIGLEPKVGAAKFAAIRDERPGKMKPTSGKWSELEWDEFEAQVQPLAARFDYPIQRG